MSKKEKDTTKTLLLIGGGALAAYLLIPRVKEAVAGAIPEFPSIDLSKLFPEGGLPLTIAYPEMDFGAAISDTLAGLLTGLGLPTGADAAGGQPDIPIIPPTEPVTEKGWWETFKGEAVKVAEYGAIVGGGYVGLRYLAPPAARAIGGVGERLASRLFATKAAQIAAKVPTAGEALGPAAATKLPGQVLKYPKPSFWGRLFGRGAGMTFGLATIPAWWAIEDPLRQWVETMLHPAPQPLEPGAWAWEAYGTPYMRKVWVPSGPTQPLPYAPPEMAWGEPSPERIVELYQQHRAGGGGDEGGGGGGRRGDGGGGAVVGIPASFTVVSKKPKTEREAWEALPGW